MSPGRIALLAARALAVAVFVLMTAQQLIRHSPNGLPVFVVLATAAVAGLVLGGIAWIGTYLGTRLSKPSQRTPRLGRWLSLTYAVLGLLLSLPISTHAVKMDMPPAASTHAAPTLALFSPLVMTLAIPLIIAVVCLIITRSLAAVLGSRDGHEN